MPEERSLRALQLIGDTDASAAHLAAIALHRELVGCGLEVRTLALAPGRRGGLEMDVPAVAPNRRSIAARGQVLKESKWADVVVVHAPRALTIATLAPRRPAGPPVVVAFWDAPTGAPLSKWSVERRVVCDAAQVVVAREDLAAAVTVRHARSSGIEVVPADVRDQGRPRVDGAAWATILSAVAR